MDEIVITSGWRATLQDLVARRRDSWPLLLLIGAVALFAIVLGGRDAPAQVAPPATEEAGPSLSSTAGNGASGTLLVHVAGAVRKPDLYEFPEGARVADAIETAGGPLPRADVDELNLAAPLSDGTKVLVLKLGEHPSPGATSSSVETSPVPVNAADQAQLETLPGIGPITAQAILEYRERVRRFDSLEQLLDVDGIGPATLDDIRSYLTL